MKSLRNMLFVVALLTAWAAAQRAAAPGFAGGSHLAAHSFSPAHRASSLRSGSSSNFRHSSSYAPYASLPFPFFSDAFDPGDIYSSGYPVASDPPPYVLEAAREMASRGSSFAGATSGAGSGTTSAPQPVLIELQSGRYVRVNNSADDEDAGAINFAKLEAQPASIAPATTAPAVLIFRDGHREEVRDYTIANGILYARGDYYVDGYWNKQISLASLDLPQTLQANASRKVKFDLPSSPNEVITRF
jgi:hypothetical protein